MHLINKLGSFCLWQGQGLIAVRLLERESNMLQFLDNPTRHLLFTGKGGVGKTSLSCAASVALADSGKRVLLVSTDPASNLDEVLGAELTAEAKEVPSVERLSAFNIDPEAAA